MKLGWCVGGRLSMDGLLVIRFPISSTVKWNERTCVVSLYDSAYSICKAECSEVRDHWPAFDSKTVTNGACMRKLSFPGTDV